MELSDMRGDFRSMDELRRANRASGSHWFDAGTLRFFRSRVSDTLYAGHVFVTSESYMRPEDGRAYTVRAAHADGSVRTVGDFMAYATRGAAHRAAALVARQAQARGQYACACHADTGTDAATATAAQES